MEQKQVTQSAIQVDADEFVEGMGLNLPRFQEKVVEARNAEVEGLVERIIRNPKQQEIVKQQALSEAASILRQEKRAEVNRILAAQRKKQAELDSSLPIVPGEALCGKHTPEELAELEFNAFQATGVYGKPKAELGWKSKFKLGVLSKIKLPSGNKLVLGGVLLAAGAVALASGALGVFKGGAG